uniref:Uncharacterized protein n=1 Tax=Steinernema glaseri TaxID=37863 RepID=A0A1I7ZKD3_9BILA
MMSINKFYRSLRNCEALRRGVVFLEVLQPTPICPSPPLYFSGSVTEGPRTTRVPEAPLCIGLMSELLPSIDKGATPSSTFFEHLLGDLLGLLTQNGRSDSEA